MAYRSDLEAARARVEALETDLTAALAELESVRAALADVTAERDSLRQRPDQIDSAEIIGRVIGSALGEGIRALVYSPKTR